MPRKARTDEDNRLVWKDMLVHIAGRKEPTFTAFDICDEMQIEYPCAAQVLGRMRRWGHVRLVGFENPDGNSRGRRRQVFEITKKGQNKVQYIK